MVKLILTARWGIESIGKTWLEQFVLCGHHCLLPLIGGTRAATYRVVNGRAPNIWIHYPTTSSLFFIHPYLLARRRIGAVAHLCGRPSTVALSAMTRVRNSQQCSPGAPMRGVTYCTESATDYPLAPSTGSLHLPHYLFLS